MELLDITIMENERVDDLQYKGLKLIQKRDGFCFGIDAVLLSYFAQVPKNGAVIDLGTGTGIIAVLLAAKKEPARVVGLEIQAYMAGMASRSVALNGLQDKISIVNGDIRDAVQLFGPSSFDAVVTNPPYMEKGGRPFESGRCQSDIETRDTVLPRGCDIRLRQAAEARENFRWSTDRTDWWI